MKLTTIRLVIALFAATISSLAWAQKVEVAPGVGVTRKTFSVPYNEAPFNNFVEKTASQKTNDEQFIEGMLQQIPDRAKAARAASNRGWDFVKQGDYATAAKRFNQAFLLDPRDSALYQGFAAVAASRFKDYAYADELYELAARMNEPYKTLEADRGRVLLMAGRPAAAKPFLERAVRDNPESAVPKLNLAWATLQLGDAAETCRMVAQITGIDLTAVESDLVLLKRRARCS